MINQNSINFLREYVNSPSPVGFESENQKRWMAYLKPYVDTFITDSYGTAVGVINPEAKYKVVIEAHADEISWYVNYISDNGLIYITRNGGSDHQIAPSKWVDLHTEKGIVKGYFGWPAIHTRKGNSKDEVMPTIDNIFIDVAAKNAEEVEKMGIYPGTVVTYPDTFEILNETRFVGRALDNRVGGFMIAEVGRLIKENNINLPFGLYITNSVQEEIGLRGAEMIADRIKPNVAIITDVTHDTTTPMIDQKKHGKIEMDKGPVISFAPAVQNKLREHIMEVAKQADIKIQRQPASTSTGTDTDSFAYRNGGTPSALISLPLRYMHTTVETVSKVDVEAVINLIYKSVVSLKGNETFSYFE